MSDEILRQLERRLAAEGKSVALGAVRASPRRASPDS
jgi:hypothetical protein